uniref:Uncharacterized protein n=1 Tax=Anguilla anguilla TaxID=7936 RepID=A0A0E9PJG6_ANGAN
MLIFVAHYEMAISIRLSVRLPFPDQLFVVGSFLSNSVQFF